MDEKNSRLLHADVTDPIIGAFFQVYNALAFGIPETAYHRAMRIALRARGLKFQTEKVLPVYFCEQLVGEFRADLIVEDRVIIEIKTGPRIIEAHTNQLAGYLRLAGLQVGIILNFGPEPKFERYFLKSRTSPIQKSDNPMFPKGR